MEGVYKVECIERKNYKKYIFTKEQKDLVVKLYNELGSSVDVGERFNVGHKVITKILEERGIKRTAAKKRQYKINEHYFDEIDTQNKAYILGFLYADGCNFPKKGTISMSLEERDKGILDRICYEMHNEHPLEFIDYSNKHDFGYTYKNQYRLLMFSSQMCEALESHGMVPNKSLVLSFPNIREDLLPHFIRGYFDGDGSIAQGRRDTNFILTITSTNSFCEKLKYIVENNVGINCHIYDASNHNGVTKVFTTNLIYRIPDLYERDWYCEVDMSKYISLLINTLNHDETISGLLNPVKRIENLLEKIGQNK